MAHIHDQPNQHDLTACAFIIRQVDGEWRCLVHMHKKLGKLLQIGGHVELHETPWQSVAHELREEAGYELSDLQLLQPKMARPVRPNSIQHPMPIDINTHRFSPDHFHTDLAYGFVATAEPQLQPLEDESLDLRWLTVTELKAAAARGEAIEDIVPLYEYLVNDYVNNWQLVDPLSFSIENFGPANA